MAINSISPASGSGNGTIAVSAGENISSQSVSKTVTVTTSGGGRGVKKTQSVKVIQQAASNVAFTDPDNADGYPLDDVIVGFSKLPDTPIPCDVTYPSTFDWSNPFNYDEVADEINNGGTTYDQNSDYAVFISEQYSTDGIYVHGDPVSASDLEIAPEDTAALITRVSAGTEFNNGYCYIIFRSNTGQFTNGYVLRYGPDGFVSGLRQCLFSSSSPAIYPNTTTYKIATPSISKVTSSVSTIFPTSGYTPASQTNPNVSNSGCVEVKNSSAFATGIAPSIDDFTISGPSWITSIKYAPVQDTGTGNIRFFFSLGSNANTGGDRSGTVNVIYRDPGYGIYRQVSYSVQQQGVRCSLRLFRNCTTTGDSATLSNEINPNDLFSSSSQTSATIYAVMTTKTDSSLVYSSEIGIGETSSTEAASVTLSLSGKPSWNSNFSFTRMTDRLSSYIYNNIYRVTLTLSSNETDSSRTGAYTVLGTGTFGGSSVSDSKSFNLMQQPNYNTTSLSVSPTRGTFASDGSTYRFTVSGPTGKELRVWTYDSSNGYKELSRTSSSGAVGDNSLAIISTSAIRFIGGSCNVTLGAGKNTTGSTKTWNIYFTAGPGTPGNTKNTSATFTQTAVITPGSGSAKRNPFKTEEE